MTLEGKRTAAWLPAIVPGLVWNLQGGFLYGEIILLTIWLAAISSVLALVLAAIVRCPCCEQCYFAFLLPLFVFKSTCQRCGYRDATGSV